MRIAWLSQYVPFPPTSGALERSYHLLRHAAQRHEVHLLALDQRSLAQGGPPMADRVAALQAICASVRVCEMPFDQAAWRRTLARALSVVAPVPYDRIWLHSGAMHRGASALGALTPPALLHVDTTGLMPYARHFPGAPVVLHHHNVESALTARRARREPSRWRALLLEREAHKQERAERDSCPEVAMNLVVSSLDADRLQAAAPASPIRVVENGVDAEYFSPAPDPGPEGGLVFAGTLGWYANREAARVLASEILPALNAAGPRRPLALVGRDPQRNDWGAEAAAVTAPGYVPDIRPFVRNACIYVCPIRDGGGTRLKVLAALAMEKPLVATALAVEGLRLVEDVHYLRAESVGDFVAQIRRLESDAALRRRLGEAGRALVAREYDWSVVGRQLDTAYAEAASRSRGAW